MPFAEVRITNQDGLFIAIFTASGYRKNTTLSMEPKPHE